MSTCNALQITRQQVVDTARRYVGVRYLHYGRDKNGLDCVGLLVRVGLDLGVQVDDLLEYDRQPTVKDAETLRLFYRRQTVERDVRNIQKGNLAMFKQAHYPCHLGIVFPEGGEMKLIHANIFKRRVVEQPLGDWYHDLIEVRDYPGVR